jgi:glycosyltransferase involved in cell wall biosynthesis
MQENHQIFQLHISLIIPVYNRPLEIQELLESLSKQTDTNFEVVIVEDGSGISCEHIIKDYQSRLTINYFFKENTGPGLTRNYGMEKAAGNYFIFLDSDCILPTQYIEVVRRSLLSNWVDAFGGPDEAHESFSNLQKAINYSMTSFFTTGGIRGGGEKLDKFYPRSFNMGISKEVYQKTGGFPSARFAKAKAAGEDIELSILIRKNGFSIGLIKGAFVYHKRRIDIKKFFLQVYNFGYARISLYKRNKQGLKLVHLLPAVFTISVLCCLFLSFVSIYFLLPLVLFASIIFFDASIRNSNILIGFIAILTTVIQLIGYGLGFIKSFFDQFIIKKVVY